MTIAVIDYGVGNLRSVVNAFRRLGVTASITDQPADLSHANAIVLPGVGAFGEGIGRLRASGFVPPLLAAVRAGTPLLGICLGLQFLFDVSEEMGEHTGLSLLPGRVVRFPADGLKVPHIGWNQLWPCQPSPLIENVPNGGHAYFVHSYYVEPADTSVVLARTDYGVAFPSVVAAANIYGAQFHPEKSQQVGLTVLANFVGLIR